MRFWKSKKQKITVQRPKIQQRKKSSATAVRTDLAKKRRNENFKRRISEYVPILKRLKILIIPILALIIIIGAVALISKSEIFKVTNYEIITDNPANEPELISYAKSFFEDKNYFISESSLKDYLNESVGNIENVYLRKSINEGLEIEILFKTPEFYLINFSGIYILSDQGQVVNVFSEGTEIAYDNLERKYLNNELSVESEDIRSIYLSRIESVEEKNRVVWKDVPFEDKQKILQEITDSINNKKNAYIAAQFEKIKASKYSELTGFRDYKDVAYDLDENFDKERLVFIKNIKKEFQKRNYDMFNIKWISEFSLSLESSSISNATKEIIFSQKRAVEDQFKDIDTLVFYNRAAEFRIIDLRSENYVLVR